MTAVPQEEGNYHQATSDMAEQFRFSDHLDLAALRTAVTCSRVFTEITLLGLML